MAIRRLQRTAGETAKENEENRTRLLDVQQEIDADFLRIEELNAKLMEVLRRCGGLGGEPKACCAQVEQWDRQNDALRWNMQDMLDQNSQLMKRKKMLQRSKVQGNRNEDGM